MPSHIVKEISSIVPQLERMGWKCKTYTYDAMSFGNWQVIYAKSDDDEIRLTKDRGQYSIEIGDMELLQKHDLWRAFDSGSEFQIAVRKFLMDVGTSEAC